MNFTRSRDNRVYRHSSFPSYQQRSPCRKGNIPLSQFHENQRTHQACLGGSSQTNLPSVSHMAKKLKRFQVWGFGVWFLTHHSLSHQERGFARFFPRAAARASAMPGTRLPAAAQGGDSPRLTLSGCHTLPSLAHPRLTSQPLPRHVSHSGKTRGAHTHKKPPPLTSTAQPLWKKTPDRVWGVEGRRAQAWAGK